MLEGRRGVSNPTIHNILSRERKITEAREAKCRAICKHVIGEAIRVLREFDEDSWLNLAAQSGVNKPSVESQELIIDKLRDVVQGGTL